MAHFLGHDAADHSNLSESETDDYIPSVFEDDDLFAINKTATKYLNYTNQYVPKWEGSEAFREIYQNWRDGIMNSHMLSLSEFTTEYTEHERTILIRAFTPGTAKLLGFIRFAYDREGFSIGGGLKIANFNASLQGSMLRTGGTTKHVGSGQTGQFGEGLKLSALVFRRLGYKFHIESTGFKWNFIYQQHELACKLSRIPDMKLKEGQDSTRGLARTTDAHAWEDVCVVIGAPGKTRNISGQPRKGERIHVDEFKIWLRVTLDINPPKKIVRTSKGFLIRDPTYRGLLYLQGLLFPRGGTSAQLYRYGYNFFTGTTTRDRTSLSGASEEGRRVAEIWAAAIREDDSDDSDILTEYTRLILESINESGDVMLNSKRNPLKEDIAEKIWGQMLLMNQDQEGRMAFYYVAKGKDDVSVIEQSLKMNPVLISQDLWDILADFGLCRTPQDEVMKRFKFAGIIQVPSTRFAAHMSWRLNCILQASPATRDMKLHFVDGRHLNVNVGLTADEWRIHDKWLTWEGAHECCFCDADATEEPETFVCDHAVLKLWDMMMTRLTASKEHSGIASQESNLRDMGRVRLSRMPRSIKCDQTDRKGQLLVTWKSADSYQNRAKPVRVILHHTVCSQCQSTEDPTCLCSTLKSEAVSTGALFEGLDPDKWYIPSVLCDIPGALVALQPEACSPRGEDTLETRHFEALQGAADILPVKETSGISNSLSNSRHRPSSVIGDSEDDDDPVSASPVLGGSSRYGSPVAASQCVSDSDATPASPGSVLIVAVEKDDVTVREKSSVQGGQLPEISEQIPREDVSVNGIPNLGDPIDQQILTHMAGFPSNYDFFRVRDTGDEEIYVIKRQRHTAKGKNKRPQLNDDSLHQSKAPRLQAPLYLTGDRSGAPVSPSLYNDRGDSDPSTVRGASVADSLYDIQPASNATPSVKTCAVCVNINKGKSNVGRFAQGRFMPGSGQCMICSIRKARGDLGEENGVPTTPSSVGSVYKRPSAQTVSPTPPTGGRVTYRF